MQNGTTYPHLDSVALSTLTLLGSPLYIYSFVTERVCWSNDSGRKFWNATSEEDLHNRLLTPFSTSTEIRLAEYRKAFQRGEDRLESWTFYPKGQAASALCRIRGVSLDGHAEAMLVEIHSLPSVELPASELRAIEALRHTSLMITLFSERGEVLMRNPAALACFGTFDQAQPAGADHFRAMFAEPADAELILQDAREHGIARRTATMAIADWPVHGLQLSLVSDPATGDSAMLMAQMNVSDAVQMGRQLAASEDALESALSLNVVPSLVLAADDGEVLQANHAAELLLGTGLLAGDSFERFFENPGDYDSFRASVLSAGVSNAQSHLRTVDGRVFWASLAAARISYAKQDALIVKVNDVDQLYQTAAELEAALDSERRVSDMQRRFLAIASHEFRNPLAIIDGAAQRLERSADSMSPDQVRGRATRIRNTVKRLLSLLDNTLERAKSDHGTMGYAPELQDIAPLIASVAQTFIDSNAALTVDLQIPALPAINMDRGLMEQAFGNLFSNAVKYSDEDPCVEVRAVVNSEVVQIFIRDRGIGIPAAEQGRIFSDYVRGTNVGEKPGTGLGLAIVRQIIQLHGGLIEIVETDGPGTTFKITLPRP